ncbi:MAG: hypothetical protein BWK78_03115 [Thiotrichaceae bacterium IS1]|nr:MAG: hypothetical protein BWK78_03115 [Thiotrichaceae bacterium IS1]
MSELPKEHLGKEHFGIEGVIETVIFQSRWLLAPLYLGLVGTLLILMVKFIEKLTKLAMITFSASSTELIIHVLGLIDVVLIANLLLIIIFSGYENFVSKIDAVKGHVDRPDWMGKVDYTALKLKVIGSIVAISSIELLKVFINIHNIPQYDAMWQVIIHLTFVVSGVLFALMERILHPPHAHEGDKHSEENDCDCHGEEHNKAQ